MNIITITSNPKEKVIDSAKRAVNQATLLNKTVKLNYRGIECQVSPNQDLGEIISYVAKFNNILKKHKL